MKYLQKKITLLALLVLVLLLAQESRAADPSPPNQPLIGPGSYNYEHKAITVSGPFWPRHPAVNKDNKYFLFQPADPTPEEAPVILFLHGWMGIYPTQYITWIGHIVKKGYIVVWVQYQSDRFTLPWSFARRSIIMWKDALKRLDSEDSPIRPEKDETGRIKTAIVGHSAGGYLSAVIAAKASGKWRNIPKPYAIVCVEPGGLHLIPRKRLIKNIDFNTKVIIVVGDEDNVVCKSTAQKIWDYISHIPDQNKEFLLVKSDYHGTPRQISNHFFPGNSGYSDTAVIDARDFYVTFKLSVGTFNCAFQGTDCEYSLENGSDEQVYMGEWSDGTPMIPMTWVEDPNSLETTCNDSLMPTN